MSGIGLSVLGVLGRCGELWWTISGSLGDMGMLWTEFHQALVTPSPVLAPASRGLWKEGVSDPGWVAQLQGLR